MLYLEDNQSVQYFPQQISFTTLLLNIEWKKQENIHKFNKQMLDYKFKRPN